MRYLYPVKRRTTTVMSVLLAPAQLLKCTISRTVYHTSVIQTIKQVVQLFRERYTET
jgi:hypothetical protein